MKETDSNGGRDAKFSPAFGSLWTFAGPSEESVILAKAVSR
jgi:hypothetical protein